MKTTISESEIQMQVVQYLEILQKQGKVLFFSGIGNGQWQKSIAVRLKMQREGIRPGTPDLFIVLKKRIIFIELKSEKGKPTDAQKVAINAINTVGDPTGIVSAYLAFSFLEAKAIIDGNM